MPRGAHAETPPNAWDRAKDPAAGARYKLHLKIHEYLLQAGGRNQPLHNLFLDRARAELEVASAATSPDLRLQFDLGVVYQDLDRYEEALAVLEPALALAPRDAESVRGWEAYAFAAAHLDRSQDEIRGYNACLELALSDDDMLSVISNRAEAYMRLGNLEEAVAGYRDVIERIAHGHSGNDFETLVLARWGLAVALDRSGEPAEAEHEARLAAEMDPVEQIIGDGEHVFFVPAYERDWYYALGRVQHAKLETDPERALAYWNLAVRTWEDYVQRAAPKDRWVALARAHLASALVEQRAASEREAKGKPKVEPPRAWTPLSRMRLNGPKP